MSIVGLPSKNAHSPNYCSWLAVCVNYSVNFYCKIALINRFKLYLIKKILTVTSKNKNKENVNKNNVFSGLVILTANHVNNDLNVRGDASRATPATARQRLYDTSS